MKKILILVVAFLSLLLTGCFGPGTQDWTYDITDEYSIIRSNTQNIVLTKNNTEVIPTYVKEFAFTDKYILVKRTNIENDKPSEKIANYYIVNIENSDIIKIDDKTSFDNNIGKLNIQKLNWIKTYPRPEGAR